MQKWYLNALEAQSILLQVDLGLVTLEHVESEQEINVFALHDSKCAGHDSTANFDLCMMHATKNAGRAYTTGHASITRIHKTHDAAPLGTVRGHDGSLGARVDESLDWRSVDFSVDVEHVHANEDCLRKHVIISAGQKLFWHTFWILVVRLFEILDDTVLANKLFDLALCLDVEGVLVEQGDLVLALALGVLGLSLPHDERFSPAVGVVDSSCELGIAGAEVGLGGGVCKELLSHALWIRIPHTSARRGAVLHRRPVLADEHGQHLTVLDSGIL
ncbi:hypothetical protein BKA63DRAFT_189760 [Paraphoma chrysanthemicola]|nr:hypothetical protein BKA63DRAFT_189760 [Paraphoma chrysanthemicola]